MSSRTPALLACTTLFSRGSFDRSIRSATGIERLLLFLVVAVLILTGLPEKATAQDFNRNSVFAEGSLSGHAFYSVNYERRLTAHLGARAGVLLREGINNEVDVSATPVMINLMDGFHRLGKHRFELGIGPLVGVAHKRLENGTISRSVQGGFIAATGYRYQPFERGVLFRLGLTALHSGGSLHQSFHLGIGYTL